MNDLSKLICSSCFCSYPIDYILWLIRCMYIAKGFFWLLTLTQIHLPSGWRSLQIIVKEIFFTRERNFFCSFPRFYIFGAFFFCCLFLSSSMLSFFLRMYQIVKHWVWSLDFILRVNAIDSKCKCHTWNLLTFLSEVMRRTHISMQ